ncbi:MAG: shikimate kinase [Acidimicrobiia bacterium]
MTSITLSGHGWIVMVVMAVPPSAQHDAARCLWRGTRWSGRSVGEVTDCTMTDHDRLCQVAPAGTPPFAHDTLCAMRRVSVVGVPGSGKTTVGRRLAGSLDAPFVELDAIFHQPDWGELPAEEFRRRALEAMTPDRWVVDGNYPAVQDLVWARADTVVWLDLPRPVVMWRIIRRTTRRVVTRERLWAGNRESLADHLRMDPNRSLIRWAWIKHGEYQVQYGAAMRSPENAHIEFIRLRSQGEVGDFITRSARI